MKKKPIKNMTTEEIFLDVYRKIAKIQEAVIDMGKIVLYLAKEKDKNANKQ